MPRAALHAVGILILTGVANVASAAGATSAVDTSEARHWIRHLVPLPKQIWIRAKVVVPAGGVDIRVSRTDDPVINQAVLELTTACRSQRPDKDSIEYFTIDLQLGGAEADLLKGLKNADQAYRILPHPAGRGLKLVALSPRGLYYAAKTLQQLIAPKAAGARLEMPLVEITDWPDLEDRGLWGADSARDPKWLADRKLNIIEQISAIGVDGRGRGYGHVKPGNEPMVNEAPRYGIKPVPVILHLEQVSGKGVLKAYPELKGQGGQEGVFCYSKPRIADVLADWMVSLGSLPNVQEVDVWMTENLHGQGGCQCAECKKQPYAVLEIRAILAGLKKARQRLPKLGIRVLTSEETEPSNPQVFKELPPDVKLWYYHSLDTYTSGESPMIKDYVGQFAKEHWVGVCPSLIGAIHFAQPSTLPHFVHYRMNEFVDKDLKGLLGYVTPRVAYAAFSVEAAAEWSWNAKGRSPREFAVSWAVRQGMKDPEKFAEWCEMLGPAAWDVFGSNWPAGEQRKHPASMATLLRERRVPRLGSIKNFRYPWADIQTPEQLDGDVAAAEKALAMAQDMGEERWILESRIVLSYLRAMKALNDLKPIVTPDGVAPERRGEARRLFKSYVEEMNNAAGLLPQWEALIPGRDPGDLFTSRPVKVIRQMIEEMTQVARELEAW